VVTTLRNVDDLPGEFASVVGFHEFIPIVGRPIAFGIGFVVLVLLAFGGGVVDAVVTVVHEGGHMITVLMTGRGVTFFELTGHDDRTDGATQFTRIRGGLGASNIIIGFSGYPAPSLAGLGGAYAIGHGNSWGVLWVSIILLLAVLLVRSNGTARTFTLLLVAGVLWTTVAGSMLLQASVAVGVVWLLLIGGLRQTLVDNVKASDATALSAMTWIPSFFWFGCWLLIDVLSLWFGGRVILGYA
jgi:hypothetical protein